MIFDNKQLQAKWHILSWNHISTSYYYEYMVQIALCAQSNTIYTVYATQFLLAPLIVSASKQLPY